MKCVLCSKKMFFHEASMTHVCLDKTHGPLAYFLGDECYFTARKEIGIKLEEMGKRYHLISKETLEMLGLKA
jgi:hypothetical protein